jgi:crotonobetainyl-CoA:carnitine CoA-transferase CaiB-like acyl-CoA transferase
MRDRPGADPQVQYFSGFWSLNGQRGERAEVYRHFTQMDATSGNYAAQAVIMALLARKRTGRGQRIDLSMLRATAALQTVGLSAHLATGEVASPLGSAAFATAPDRAFRCLDGEWIGISVTSEPQWAAFCTAIECPELLDDPRFATNQSRVHHRSELAALLEPRFASLPRHHWILRLDDAGVPCGYPLTFDQLRHHAAVIENGYLPEVQTSGWGSVFTGGPPWQFERTPASWSGTPLPGEHTADILDEIAEAKRAPGSDGR